MALTKIINDESKSFRPVLTDKLVLDAVPTEGSFNGVTSDGVAKAIAEGGGGGSLEAGGGIAISEGTISAKVDGETIGVNADGELEALGGSGASYSAGAGIAINNDTISVNHDNSLSDVAGSLSVEINGMSGTFKILPTPALTMDDTLTISISSTSWAGVGIDSSNIPGYLRVKLTSVDDSSKYVISQINCRKNNDEIYLDSVWSPYGLANVAFNVYENAPLSYAFNWGSLTLGDIGLTSGNGVFVTLVMCDSNGDPLGNDLSISGLSSSACTVGSSAAPQQLSVANPVPSTNMVSSGSVLTVGSTGQPEWAAPSGGDDVVLTYNTSTWSDFTTAYAAGKNIRVVETSNGVTYEYTLHEYNPNGSPSAYAKFSTTILLASDAAIYSRNCMIRATDTWTSGAGSVQGNLSGQNAISVNPDTRRISLKLDGSSLTQSSSGLSVTTPVPAFDASTDEGKILKIVSGVPTWVTP